MAKTSLGMDEKLEAALAYFLGWITGLVFIVLEKENKYVRFHAYQSLAVFGALTLLGMALGYLPVVGVLLLPLLNLVGLILWLYLMYKAYMGEQVKLPYFGEWAEKQP